MAAGVLRKVVLREIHGSLRYVPHSKPVNMFEKYPQRCCVPFKGILDETGELQNGHVVLGFSKDGQYLISYQLIIDTDSMDMPNYRYSLHWWRFSFRRKLIKVSSAPLFTQPCLPVTNDLHILAAESLDQKYMVIWGRSITSSRSEASLHYVTICTVPSSTPRLCKQPDVCIEHEISISLSYEVLPPHPVVLPSVSLKLPGMVLLNMGDHVVALKMEACSNRMEINDAVNNFQRDQESGSVCLANNSTNEKDKSTSMDSKPRDLFCDNLERVLDAESSDKHGTSSQMPSECVCQDGNHSTSVEKLKDLLHNQCGLCQNCANCSNNNVPMEQPGACLVLGESSFECKKTLTLAGQQQADSFGSPSSKCEEPSDEASSESSVHSPRRLSLDSGAGDVTAATLTQYAFLAVQPLPYDLGNERVQSHSYLNDLHVSVTGCPCIRGFSCEDAKDFTHTTVLCKASLDIEQAINLLIHSHEELRQLFKSLQDYDVQIADVCPESGCVILVARILVYAKQRQSTFHHKLSISPRYC
ncbi:predicted protein [Nematostella vectensis]|uniref:DDB1- and CUL4-associated factor 15 WD40 repeat-containing domain-containing protein n=1 Tax=Nematostella vectensis TaxID=45351 RepID=A7RTR5_NEMVE|nr:predicted protein [Nematostella vectensis]|eukprot:XP_001637138.1 predicted protein [Nematostella vectensis]